MDNGGGQSWIGFVIAFVMVFLMGIWGGFVSHFGRLRRGEINLSRRFQELAIDVLTSSFSAVVVGLALMSADVDPLLCCALSGVGGHAGARLIFKLERVLFNRVDSFSPKK